MAKEAKVRGFFVDVDNRTFAETELDDSSIDNIYMLLHIETFDIVTRMIGGKAFTVICDDEGLLKDRPIPSAIDENYNTMLVGNLFVCKTGDDGNLKSLSDEEEEHIESKMLIGYDAENNALRPVISEMSYA